MIFFSQVSSFSYILQHFSALNQESTEEQIYVKCRIWEEIESQKKGLIHTLNEIEGGIAIRWVLNLFNVLYICIFSTGKEQRNASLSLNVIIIRVIYTEKSKVFFLCSQLTTHNLFPPSKENWNRHRTVHWWEVSHFQDRWLLGNYAISMPRSALKLRKKQSLQKLREQSSHGQYFLYRTVKFVIRKHPIVHQQVEAIRGKSSISHKRGIPTLRIGLGIYIVAKIFRKDH